MGESLESSSRAVSLLDRQVRPRTAEIISIFLIVVVTIADVLTGPYLAFSVFYLIPVVIPAWYADRNRALLIAVLAALAGMVSVARHSGAIPPGVSALNACFRLLIFAFVVFLVDAERRGRAKVVELSTTDPLTGLLNRRAFYEFAEVGLKAASRSGEPVSLAYADLDDLKVCNDRAGHGAGDALLLAFAQHLRATFRETDLAARMGGDEFCCLLPHTDASEASAVLDRLEAALRGVEAGPISVSFGVVTITPNTSTDISDLIGVADALMYEAKQAGKGQRRSRSLRATP